MKTKLSINNPFKNTVKLGQSFSWEVLSELKNKGNAAVVLDYGAYDGRMLDQFLKDGIVSKAISVDLNKEVVEGHKSTLMPGHSLILIHKGEPLPFENEKFDCITMIGVLEHVFDQSALLNELSRLLKSNGILIVAVPGKHFFSFLDLGNWKFVFPGLHRSYIEYKFGKEYYNMHFIQCVNGLFGDVEKEKKWHQHFSFRELTYLLKKSGFEVYREDGFGFFFRLLHNIGYFLPFLKGLVHKLILFDARLFTSAEIFVASRKIS
jgi:SAM-dependent methyltransferase